MVLLCSDRGWQMDSEHLKQSITRRQPAGHHSPEQWFFLLVLVLTVRLDVQLVDQLSCHLLPEVHNGIKHLEDGVQNVLAEGVEQFLPIRAIDWLAELAIDWVKVPISPQLLGHILHAFVLLRWPQLALNIGQNLGHMYLCKLLQSECLATQAQDEAYCAQDGINHDAANGPTLALSIGGDDDIDVLW